MGAQEHVRADIDRLRVAASDMRQAARGAGHLGGIRANTLDRMHSDADRALETGVIVSYARPNTRHGNGQLDSGKWEPADASDANLHHAIIRLRNIRYAHTDKTDLRGTEDVFGGGHFSESWVGLHDDAWARIETLADQQAKAFDALADQLQNVLRQRP
jgi:hypothetical protein